MKNEVWVCFTAPKAGKLESLEVKQVLAREHSALVPVYIDQLKVKLFQSQGHR